MDSNNVPQQLNETSPPPAWVTKTPGRQVYSLAMFDEGGGSLQEIDDITRKEFLLIKRFLARRRGFVRSNRRSQASRQ